MAAVFLYTLGANVVERPDGIRIAAFFIAGIIAVSLASRVWRVLELRVSGVELDDAARGFLADLGKHPLHLLAHDPLFRVRATTRPRKRTSEATSIFALTSRSFFWKCAFAMRPTLATC